MDLPLQPPDADQDERRQHDVITELTIIQAQAQMLRRKLEAESCLHHDDASDRLRSIVEAVRRLTELHR